MKVVVKIPGKLASTLKVNPTLEVLQALVGGYIETLGVSEHISLIVNECGKINGLPLNIYCPECRDYIAGTIVAVAHGADGELRSLTEKEMDCIKVYFAQCMV